MCNDDVLINKFEYITLVIVTNSGYCLGILIKIGHGKI